MKEITKKLFSKSWLKYLFRSAKMINVAAKLGKNVIIAKDVAIGKEVIIGDYTYINNYTIISSAQIGSYCSIGPFCVIGPDSHPIDWISTSPMFYKNYCVKGESDYKEIKKPPVLGNDVWVGANVIIMRGVTVGNGAVLAAGTVVTKDVLPYSIVRGVPAKHMKFRFDDKIITRIEKSNIWNRDYPKDKLIQLASNKKLFRDYL